MDDGLYVNSVWYSCKINKMKTKIINIAKDISRLDGSELSDLTAVLLNEHDINATIYHFGVSSSTSHLPYETYKPCNVFMVSAGARKLQVLKTIKEWTGLGLMETKRLVDSAPYYIMHDVSIDKAEEMKEVLESYGATIEIRDE